MPSRSLAHARASAHRHPLPSDATADRACVASELALTLAERGPRCAPLLARRAAAARARRSGPVEVHVRAGLPVSAVPFDAARPRDHLDASSTCIAPTGSTSCTRTTPCRTRSRRSWRAQPRRRKTGIVQRRASSTTLHGTDITLVGNDPSYAPLTQFVIAQLDAVTAVSESLAQAHARELLRRDARRVRDRGDPELRRHRSCSRRLPSREDAPTAVHVSNFRPVKRVPAAHSRFRRRDGGTKARLVMIGDGPDQAPRHAGSMRELDLCGRVSFLGMRDALPAF